MNDSDLIIEGTLEPLDDESFSKKTVASEIQTSRDLIVYKGNALVWGRFNLTKVELKIVNALISLINPKETLDNQPEWKFTKRDLIELGVSSIGHLHHHIDEITSNLQSQIIRLPKKDINGKPIDDGKSFEKVNLFYKSSWDDQEKIATFKFHPELEPYLINLKGHFTKYHLHQVQNMESLYGIRLYELLRSIYSLETVKKGNFGVEIPFSYQKLRDVLELGDKYLRFNNFHENVLKRAVSDLNSTDIEVTYSFPERTGPKSTRKISKIVFTISARFGFYPTEVRNGQVVKIEDLNEVKLSVKRQLLQFFNVNTAKTLLETYGIDRCLANMKLLASDNRPEKIKNASGWLVEAISKDYANGDTDTDLVDLLDIENETDIHKKRFLQEQLLPLWQTFSENDRGEFLKNRFDSGVIAARFAVYYAASLTGKIPAPAEPVIPETTKSDKQSNRDAINEELSNLNSQF